MRKLVLTISILVFVKIIMLAQTPLSKSSDQNRVIIRNSILHSFSDPNKKDSFQIEILGKSLLKGTVVFKIISYAGTELFNISFQSHDLIGYGLPENPTIIDKENYIKDRINNFFKKDNFIIPAIKKSDEFDQDFSDEEVWLDIKSDPTAIGFYYLIGEEDNRQIAYSKKNKKVVMYMNFD